MTDDVLFLDIEDIFYWSVSPSHTTVVPYNIFSIGGTYPSGSLYRAMILKLEYGG